MTTTNEQIKAACHSNIKASTLPLDTILMNMPNIVLDRSTTGKMINDAIRSTMLPSQMVEFFFGQLLLSKGKLEAANDNFIKDTSSEKALDELENAWYSLANVVSSINTALKIEKWEAGNIHAGRDRYDGGSISWAPPNPRDREKRLDSGVPVEPRFRREQVQATEYNSEEKSMYYPDKA